MNLLLSRLDEQQRRRYLAVESHGSATETLILRAAMSPEATLMEGLATASAFCSYIRRARNGIVAQSRLGEA
jgi:hypothetical protein